MQKKKKKGASTSDWGKYGTINESKYVGALHAFLSTALLVSLPSQSMYEKEEEFRTWLIEERMINPEVLSKDQTKKEFAKFAEDYNTGTFFLDTYHVPFTYTCLQLRSRMKNITTSLPTRDE